MGLPNVTEQFGTQSVQFRKQKAHYCMLFALHFARIYSVHFAENPCIDVCSTFSNVLIPARCVVICGMYCYRTKLFRVEVFFPPQKVPGKATVFFRSDFHSVWIFRKLTPLLPPTRIWLSKTASISPYFEILVLWYAYNNLVHLAKERVQTLANVSISARGFVLAHLDADVRICRASSIIRLQTTRSDHIDS